MSKLERQIVGSMLWGLPAVNHHLKGQLAAPDFSDPLCQRVFVEICEAMDDGADVDSLVVSERLGVPLAELLEMENGVEAPEQGKISAWGHELVRVSKRRRFSQFLANASAKLGKCPPSQVASAISKIVERAFEISIEGSTQEVAFMPFERVVQATIEDTRARWEAERAGGVGAPGLATGYPELDDLIGGGIQPAELTLLGGRPSMGKSLLAGNILRQCVSRVRDRCHMLVSLEMGHLSVGRRFLAAQSRVSASGMRDGTGATEDMHRLLAGARWFSENLNKRLWFLDRPGATVADVRLYLQRMMDSTGLPPGLVVIDHLHLMRSTQRGLSQGDKISAISEGCLHIARETGAAVLLLSQLSRELERRPDKRPILADLRDSGTLEQNANNVMFVYRQSVYEPDAANPNDLEVIVRKQRDGTLGTATLFYNAAEQLITSRLSRVGGAA